MLKNSKLKEETEDHYKIELPSGHEMKLSKKGLNEKSHDVIKGLQKFDNGGVVNQSMQPDYGPENNFGAQPPEPGMPKMAYQPPEQDQQKPQQMNPFEEEKSAIQGRANVIGQEGAQESSDIGNAMGQLNNLKSPEDIVKDHQAASDNLYKQLQNGKIDPNKYWNNMDTGSKVSAGLGLILGGIGGGLTGQGNLAAQMIQSAVDRDIESQKNDQSNKMNLWKMNREQLGDDMSANLATRNQYLTMLKYKLDQTASQFKGPAAQQAANLQKAQIDQQIYMNNMRLGMHSALTGQAGPGDEGTFVQNLNNASLFDPAMAKDAQEKYIPGVGIAKVPVTPDDRKSLASSTSFNDALLKAKNLMDQTGEGGAWSGENRATAQALKSELTTRLGELVNLKRFTPEEAKFYQDRIPDLGAVKVTDKDKGLMDNLIQSAQSEHKAFMSQHGVTPFRGVTSSIEEAAAPRVERYDPKSGKVAIFNANTKQFIGYK